MSLLEGVFLGVLQGLTEFLPVSSSGHLVIAQSLLPHFHQPGVLFDVLVHGGTLGAVCVYYRHRLFQLLRVLRGRPEGGLGAGWEARRLLFLLVVGSLPTALIGLGFQEALESLFHHVEVVGVMLGVTGILLILTDRVHHAHRGIAAMGVGTALLVGLAQGLAIIPGLSRSGTTIAVGTLLGLERRVAMEYSFLLSIPAITGALVWELLQLDSQTWQTVSWGAFLAGTAVAAGVGYASISLLFRVLQGRRLTWFAGYCWVVGLGVLLFL